MINENLNNLIAAARVTTDEAQTCFGNLTVEQLNWKPGTDQWSVAQCFDHLVTAHGAYVPIIESVLSGKKKRTFWESVPFLPSLWGRFLVNGVAPESKRKLKAPKVLRPESSNIDEGIISRFIEQQNQIINYMKATQNMDLEKIIITSSVANVGLRKTSS